MNVAEFKGLLRSDLREIPIVLYFHENQFVYPNRFGQERDRHFPFTNFISAIAADKLWFNSQFNLDSLVGELGNSSKRWPDFRPTDAIDTLASKSSRDCSRDAMTLSMFGRKSNRDRNLTTFRT